MQLMTGRNLPRYRGAFAPLGENGRPPVQFVEDFYVEPLNFLALAGGASATNNILVQADSAFKISKLGYQADIALATLTEATNVIPLVTVNIIDSGSGRNIFGNPVALGALFGNGREPFILPVPRIFSPRSNISVTVANLTAATTYNLRLAFIGSKIFEQGGNQ